MVPRLLILLLVLAGCTASEVEVRPREAYLNYTVQQDGENLAGVARRFTGSSANWKALRDYNPGINPYHLTRGEVVRIPASIMASEIEREEGDTAVQRRRPQAEATPPPRPESPVPSERTEPSGAKAPEGSKPAAAQPTPAPIQRSPAPAAEEEQHKKLRDKLLEELLREEQK